MGSASLLCSYPGNHLPAWIFPQNAHCSLYRRLGYDLFEYGLVSARSLLRIHDVDSAFRDVRNPMHLPATHLANSISASNSDTMRSDSINSISVKRSELLRFLHRLAEDGGCRPLSGRLPEPELRVCSSSARRGLPQEHAISPNLAQISASTLS